MKLTLEQIKSITFGTDYIWQEEDCIRFRRCTEAQVAVWSSISGMLGEQSHSSCGVRFDLHTDSSRFDIQPSAPGPFEVHIDGIMVRYYDWESYADTDGWIRIPLGEGTHRVTVLFPMRGAQFMGIRQVEVDDGATLTPYAYDCKILFYGDSITQGSGASCISVSYAQRVAKALNADFLNQGIGGSFFAPRAFPDDLEYDPDIVIVAYGTNDWGFYAGSDRLALRAGEYLDKLCTKYAGKKLFGISPIWRSNGASEVTNVGTFQECCDIVKNAIRSHNMILIEGEQLVPHQGMFFTDGLHPNDLGHSCYANALLQKMQPYL